MKKWISVLPALLLIAVLAVAGILYNQLGSRVGAEQLMTVPAETEPQTTAPPETTEAPTETTETPTETTEAPDLAAPDFTVFDWDGNEVTLTQLQGKPVILNFWATWCGFCVSEMPEFEAACQQYGDRINFMMVNVTDGQQETREVAQRFITDKGFTFPVYFDEQLSAAYAYGVNAMPVTYFIDENGDFVAWAQGALDGATIQQGIDMLLGE